MTDEWTRAEKRKAQSEQAKATMDFVSMLSDKIAELEKENAELKADNDARKYAMAMSEKVEKHLREQLTKARGLLRAWFQYCIDTKGKTPLKIETAQFLKEIEK